MLSSAFFVHKTLDEKYLAFHEKRRFSKDHLQGIVTLCLVSSPMLKRKYCYSKDDNDDDIEVYRSTSTDSDSSAEV